MDWGKGIKDEYHYWQCQLMILLIDSNGYTEEVHDKMNNYVKLMNELKEDKNV